MSRQLINEYRGDLDRLRAVSGSRRESVLREAFKDLLKRWGRSHDLQFVPEHTITTPQKNRIYLDGALLHALRVPFGYWEAKDADDDLDAEIAAKARKGYPRDNIIYSDDHTAVLIQDGHEVSRVAMEDTDALYPLLVRYFAHERQEIADFNKAVRQFSLDLPAVLEALRELIAKKRSASKLFSAAEIAFLSHAQEAINPAITREDVQEMLIQHILTEDIFAKVFDNPDFHRQNNVASELYKLESKLFARGEKSTLLRALSPYYSGMARTAAVIQSHSEKQGFLKGLYENFYKVYNEKAADRLGVVYTPGEIVRFIIRSADWLCEMHFGKNLVDRGVEILDPATGTGTFIVELLEHFRGHHSKLRHKYKSEIHANEVAILPYYVANLNIEATYQAITGQFAEFENLCFVDTLDNVDALGIHAGHQFDLLGSLTDENIERIKRQNRAKISVVMGNPPYNAWQESFDQDNANRPYGRVDQRIRQTYVKEGSAQNQSSVYDMYTRFVRWASDRLGDEGIVAFVMGRKPIAKAAYDGFRKVAQREFADIWLMDLGGDVRDNPELSGTVHNVFGIQTGVMIALFVKRRGESGAKIHYVRRPEMETASDKLSWLNHVGSFEFADCELIKPDHRDDWINQSEGGWESFLPLTDRKAKTDERASATRAIFKIVSSGVQTKQDDWAFGWTQSSVSEKMIHLIGEYDRALTAGDRKVAKIKWHRELNGRLTSGTKIAFDEGKIVQSLYRPFSKRLLYFDRLTNSQSFRLHDIYRGDPNKTIALLGVASSNPLAAFASDIVFDTCLLKNGNGSTQGAPRYRYNKSGEQLDNITDWAVNKFVRQYGRKGVSKDSIFNYVYAVLHDPIYRQTHALNLKRELPRIPFYPDFPQWSAWGERLMEIHIGYEHVTPWPVERIEKAGRRAKGTSPKPVLRSQPDQGVIVIDADTQLSGIPAEAWTYRLGNRSAIDWVLDQHKERKPRDATISALFDLYRFADRKESMIELLGKVVRVSVDTVEITSAMAEADRGY